MAQPRQPVTRGFGRYRARYRQIIPGINQSLGQKDIGKVKIDCCYLEDSICGVLEQHPAWLLYLDINIHQPRGCKLASATITLTFNKDVDAIPTQSLSSVDTPRLGPQVTKFFGPKGIQDQPHDRRVNKEWNFGPELSVLGNSGRIGNIKRGSDYVASSRWLIRGQWWPIHDEQLGVSLYRRVNWYMEESKFDEQTLHSNSIHVGAILQHDLDPLQVEVRIEGKLQGLSGAFRFPPLDKPAIVLSKFTPKNGSISLDHIARVLEDELTKKNQVPVPELGQYSSASRPSNARDSSADGIGTPSGVTPSHDAGTDHPSTTSPGVEAVSTRGISSNIGASLLSLTESAICQIAPIIQAGAGSADTQDGTPT